jgi:hypothetical protein
VIAISDQELQEVKDLRLDGAQLAVVTQLTPVGVN